VEDSDEEIIEHSMADLDYLKKKWQGKKDTRFVLGGKN